MAVLVLAVVADKRKEAGGGGGGGGGRLQQHRRAVLAHRTQVLLRRLLVRGVARAQPIKLLRRPPPPREQLPAVVALPDRSDVRGRRMVLRRRTVGRAGGRAGVDESRESREASAARAAVAPQGERAREGRRGTGRASGCNICEMPWPIEENQSPMPRKARCVNWPRSMSSPRSRSCSSRAAASASFGGRTAPRSDGAREGGGPRRTPRHISPCPSRSIWAAMSGEFTRSPLIDTISSPISSPLLAARPYGCSALTHGRGDLPLRTASSSDSNVMPTRTD